MLAEFDSKEFSLAPSALGNSFLWMTLCVESTPRSRTKCTERAYRAFRRWRRISVSQFSCRSPSLLNTVPPDCREMEVPIELDRNEAINTLGLLRNPSSYQFLIIKGTFTQNCEGLKNTPVSKRNGFSIVAAIFGPFALISPNKCVCACCVEQSESVSSSFWQRCVAGRAVIVY